MTDKKWLVPDVIDPAEKVCVQIEIPNDVKHIAAFWGALEQLSKAYNWEDSYVDGSQTAYVWRDAIADASELVKTGVNCMLDCDDVEDCLETSTIIDVIETDIIDNTVDIVVNITNITDNTTEITNITENPPDGNVYPEPPDPLIEPDAACGAAYYVVAKIREFIVDMEGYPVAYPDIWDAMEALLLGDISLAVAITQAVLATLYDPVPPPSVLTDFDAQVDEMREQLYCAGFDKGDFSTYVATLPLSGTEIAAFVDCIAFGAWSTWISTGEMDDTQDCTSYLCGQWCREWSYAEGWGAWALDMGTPTALGIESTLSPLPYAPSAKGNGVWMTHVKVPTCTEIEIHQNWTGLKTVNTFFYWYEQTPEPLTWSEVKPPSMPEDPNPSSRIIVRPHDGSLGVGEYTIANMTGAWASPPEDTGGYLCYTSKIIMRGVGANPFGGDNCV